MINKEERDRVRGILEMNPVVDMPGTAAAAGAGAGGAASAVSSGTTKLCEWCFNPVNGLPFLADTTIHRTRGSKDCKNPGVRAGAGVVARSSATGQSSRAAPKPGSRARTANARAPIVESDIKDSSDSETGFVRKRKQKRESKKKSKKMKSQTDSAAGASGARVGTGNDDDDDDDDDDDVVVISDSPPRARLTSVSGSVFEVNSDDDDVIVISDSPPRARLTSVSGSVFEVKSDSESGDVIEIVDTDNDDVVIISHSFSDKSAVQSVVETSAPWPLPVPVVSSVTVTTSSVGRVSPSPLSPAAAAADAPLVSLAHSPLLPDAPAALMSAPPNAVSVFIATPHVDVAGTGRPPLAPSPPLSDGKGAVKAMPTREISALSSAVAVTTTLTTSAHVTLVPTSQSPLLSPPSPTRSESYNQENACIQQ